MLPGDLPTHPEALRQLAQNLAGQVAQVCQQRSFKLVLAESCTGGALAALLTAIPGASHWFCGSFVVYQAESKIHWLGLDPQGLAQHSPESIWTSTALCKQALRLTPQATLGLGITGHLGPQAPSEQDGQIYLAMSPSQSGKRAVSVTEATHQLPRQVASAASDETNPPDASIARQFRAWRQLAAATLALHDLLAVIEASSDLHHP